MHSDRFSLRPEALAAPSSGIVEVFDYGRNRPGLMPLWVGEGDRPTPRFIIEAAEKSLADGETFYTHQAGIPPLREAIAAYLTRSSGHKVGPERIFVTGGGMHALQIAVRMIAGLGDEVIVPTPAWPNFRGALEVAGAATCEVPMRFGNAGWQLDIEDVARAITPRTRALCINSPRTRRAGLPHWTNFVRCSPSRASMGSGSSPMRSTASSSMMRRARRPSGT